MQCVTCRVAAEVVPRARIDSAENAVRGERETADARGVARAGGARAQVVGSAQRACVAQRVRQQITPARVSM